MEYYKKYRIIENISHAESINHLIDFFHRLPIIGKHTGDKYRLFGFKKFVYTLGLYFLCWVKLSNACYPLSYQLS